jgi:hypothetical protein
MTKQMVIARAAVVQNNTWTKQMVVVLNNMEKALMIIFFWVTMILIRSFYGCLTVLNLRGKTYEAHKVNFSLPIVFSPYASARNQTRNHMLKSPLTT